LGPLNPEDTLTFDYRITDFSSDGTTATTLSDFDSLNVFLSADCGATFELVFSLSGSNQVPAVEMTNVAVPLNVFAEEAIILRFEGVWSSGDYYLDLDHINILSCGPNLALDIDLQGVSIMGASDGSISVSPQNGIPPFIYTWDNGETTANLDDLEAGTYTVTVVDALGCEEVRDIEVVTCPEDLGLTINQINESIPGAVDGAASVNPTNGTAPYIYLWSNGATTASVSNLASGSYKVTITDVNGCEEIADIEIGLGVQTNEISIIESILLAPNPSTGYSWYDIQLQQEARIEIRIFDIYGRVLSKQESIGQEVRFPLDLSAQPSGIYLIELSINGQQTRIEKLMHANTP